MRGQFLLVDQLCIVTIIWKLDINKYRDLYCDNVASSNWSAGGVISISCVPGNFLITRCDDSRKPKDTQDLVLQMFALHFIPW